MDSKKLAQRSHPQRLGSYLQNLAKQGSMHRHGDGLASSTRTEEHAGHKIVIVTTYEVKVDGRRLDAPLTVDNEGRLSCHSLPNYVFGSAVDAVKQLLDSFPEEFSGQKRKTANPSSGAHASMEHASPGRGARKSKNKPATKRKRG